MSDVFELFCPYQLAWGQDQSGLRLAEKSRRIGWTYFDAFDATINRVPPRKGAPKYNFDGWYSATDMSAAEEYIGYVGEFAKMIDAVAKVADDEVDVPDDEGQGHAGHVRQRPPHHGWQQQPELLSVQGRRSEAR